MGEIKMDDSAVSAASKKLKSLSDSASSTASAVKGVHTVLWLDDALTNAFSNSLVAEIKTASKALSDKQEQMGQYASLADAAAKGLVDADTGNIIGASVKLVPLDAIWASFTGLAISTWSWISGSDGDSSNSGTDHGGGSHTIPEGGGIVERIRTAAENAVESYRKDHYDYGSNSYHTVEGINADYAKKHYDQRFYDAQKGFITYNATEDKYYGSGLMCTVTALAYAEYLKDGTYHDPNGYWIDGVGANWGAAGCAIEWNIPNSGTDGIMQKAYSSLTADPASPVIYYGKTSTNNHAVTIIGVREGADPNNLGMSDFLVMDPYEGKIKTLNEVGYIGNTATYIVP